MTSNNPNTISCLVIDDEIASQRVLSHFIDETRGLELVALCHNAEQAFEMMQKQPKIDVLLLDINMPKETGLDFYKRLVNPPQVIFTTAYPQYAVDGFNLDATDYLLKPIAYDRFLAAIEKVMNRSGKKQIDYIILKENKTLHKIAFDAISHIEAYGDYVKVHATDKLIVTHSTFSNFIKLLPEHFLRVHKSFSINLNRMTQLSGNQIGVDSHRIPIGQTYKSTVIEALNGSYEN